MPFELGSVATGGGPAGPPGQGVAAPGRAVLPGGGEAPPGRGHGLPGGNEALLNCDGTLPGGSETLPSGSETLPGVPTLRGRLLLLVACIAIPFALFIAWSLQDAYRRDHARAAADLLTTVRALAAAPDAEFALAEARLRGLLDVAAQLAAVGATAADPGNGTVAGAGDLSRDDPPSGDLPPADLPPGDPARFLDRARRAGAASGSAIALYAADGRVLAATGPLPEGGAPPGRPLRARPTGLVDGRVGLWLPVPGSSGATLGLWLPPDRLGEAMRERQLPPGWVAAVLDAEGRVVGRTRRAAELVGRPALPEVRDGLAQRGEGFLAGLRNQDNEVSLLAFARSPNSGYAVVASVPQARFGAALVADLTRAGAVALTLLLGGVVGALVLARRVRTALAALADQARAGSAVPAATGLREVATVSVALAAAARDRAAAAAALRAQEERYRALVETSSEFVWLADPEGRLLPEGAAAWARLTGQDPASLVGRGWFEALHPEERGVADALWRAALQARRPVAGEWRARRAASGGSGGAGGAEGAGAAGGPDGAGTRDGSGFLGEPGTPGAARAAAPEPGPAAAPAEAPWDGNGPAAPADRVAWLSVRAVPLFDAAGAVREWIGLSADVTAARVASRALAESETRLRLALDGGGLGTWDYDPVSGRGLWSPGMAAMLGLPAVERFSERRGLAAVHPEDRERLRAALAAAVEHGDSLAAELRAARPAADGGPVWLELRARVLRDEDGRATRLVGVVRDVTERERAAEALRNREAELERLVAERSAALLESENKLAQAQKMEALGRLAGGVAHDVNNVLQAVLGGARLIAARATDTERVGRLAALVAEQAERGAAVTRRLLGFARRGELRAEPQEVPALLDGLREVLGHTLGSAVSVAVQAPAELPPVLADRAQLETVLVNLAVNARDAMPGGGRVLLAAEAAPFGASPPAELRPGRYLRLFVADTGTGMAPAVLARVTEPFFTTKGEGTGLGLAMARGFAEQSGGALGISSAPGSGTTVSLWLPVAEAAAPAAAVTAPAGAAAAARLLLVDDEPAVRAVLAGGLEERGHVVSVAGSPAAALSMLRAGVAAEVLVTDLSMPGGMDGLGLLAAARDLRPGLPGILVTGYADEATGAAVDDAAATTPTALLRKPISSEALAAAVAGLLAAPPP
ncbi:PAS domain-containing protein [Roseomonas sp. BN140053]|uniref:PAS domain-containing protein n=1 Tax=Roseomonas sp. BN140053 TaxID=3391898 RepID=UPI0039E78FAB